MKICVIIPVHNEMREIGDIVESLKKKELDVVVVDDGSMDQSGKISEEKGAFVIRNEKKSGKGLSLQKGFSYAIDNDYSGVITVDGDGQHDTEDIDQFLREAEKDPCRVITGTRMGAPQGMPFVRYTTNRFMSWLISCICKQKIPDSQCGFRYIHCEILKQIQFVSSDFEIESEVLIKASKRGYRISSVPIKTIYRNEKSKISPIKDTLKFFTYLIKETFGSNLHKSP